MKKTLLTLALVAATAAAFGQGKIGFQNDSLHYYVLGSTAPLDSALGGGTSSTSNNTVAGTTGAIPVSPLPSGASLEAVLYAGQTSSSMTLQTTLVLTGANWLSPGRQATKGVTLVGVGPGTAFFDVFVTDTGATLPASGSGGTLGTQIHGSAQAYFGDSGLFTAVAGSSITFPSMVAGASSTTWAPANLVINAVPEPASFALAGLGAAAMLIFRRRK